MKRAIILMGLPLAGKSTWIKESHLLYEGFALVSADNFKESHPEYDPNKAHILHEWSVQEARREVEHLAKGEADFIMDGGGINGSYTFNIITDLKARGYHVTLVHVKTPVEVCVERNRLRERKVPDVEIEKKAVVENAQFHRLLPLVDDYWIENYFTNKHLFVDMDGVIAGFSVVPDINGKIDFVNRELFRWLKPVPSVIERLERLMTNGTEIYILSAILNSFALNEKMEWLDKHFNVPHDRRHFVNAGRHKAEMLENLIRYYKLEKRDVTLLDDTHDTLKKVRDMGCNQLHVSEFLTDDWNAQ